MYSKVNESKVYFVIVDTCVQLLNLNDFNYTKIALIADPLPRPTFSFIEVHLHLKNSDGAKLM